MSEKDDGGPAFPAFTEERVYRNGADRSGEYLHLPVGGMTLRDYFASQALIGLIGCWEASRSMTPADVASEVYIYADAMLTERSKP